MTLVVLDKDFEREIRAQRKAWGVDQHDEVWEGVYMMSPIADNEHQDIVAGVIVAFHTVIRQTGLGQVFPGVNVSDRVKGWKKNFRAPDVVVVLKDSQAQSHSTFWTGPIDFLVEVVSPGDRSRKKLPFYSKIGVRELLIVDRRPWRLTLYRHDGTNLTSVGVCESGDAQPIESHVLPFTLRLEPTFERPKIELRHKSDGRTWLA